jgi:hypothetical protein
MTDPTGKADRFAAPWRRPRPARAFRHRTGAPGPVASLWVGEALSFVEVVVLRAFMAQGHAVTLFTLGPVAHVPEGVKVRDAAAFSPPDFDLAGLTRRFAGGVYSNVFRIDLIAETDMIWADLDAYCVRPLTPVDGYLVGSTRARQPKPNNGVLRLPRGSAALDLMRAFLHDPNPVPWWYPDHRKTFLLRQKRRGIRHGIERFPWSLSGPLLLSHALREAGEMHHVLPREALYPVDYESCVALLDPARAADEFEQPETMSVHLFGATKLHLAARYGGLPPPGSYIDRICRRHDVDPGAFPIPSGAATAEMLADPARAAAILAPGRGPAGAA